ncbi:TonB family protein [Myxococcaceae bacterium GXIMD 01537]
MAAARKSGLTLRITGPDGSTLETIAESESVIVGSGAQAAVKIQDPGVSNLHVMLKVEKDGGVTAIDLGSETGTEVGGQKLLVPRTLVPGDVITVGRSRVEVVFTDEDSGVPAGARAPAPAFQASVEQPAPMPRKPLGTVSSGRPNRVVPPGARARASEPQPAPSAPPHLQEPLPPDARPTAQARVLQVSQLWGDTLLSVEHFGDGVPVTIGEGRKNTFHVFVPEVGERHVLAVDHGGKLELRVPPGVGVIVTTDGTVRTKDALRAAGALTSAAGEAVQTFRLDLGDRAEVSLGGICFVARYVRPSPAIMTRSLEQADFTFAKISSILLLMAIAAVAAMLLRPRSETPAAEDVLQDQQRVAKLLIKPQPKQELPKKKLTGAEEGAKAKEEEGKFGKEEAKKEEADPSKPGTPIVDRSKKEKDRQKVGRVGLLGAMKGLGGGASNVFGPGGLGSGINNSLGGLKGGAGMGDARGVGGLGTRNNGKGGGGTALGIGGLGTQGNGPGTGGSGIDLGGRGKQLVKVIPGKTTVIGGLDKDVIAKVIRDHMAEIKYCYETELNKNPSLAGKVAVAFTIDPAGSVSEANVSETTLGNSTAENCMLRRIRRWKFPEPKGGGVVAVTYPWIFSPAGADTGG